MCHLEVYLLQQNMKLYVETLQIHLMSQFDILN